MKSKPERTGQVTINELGKDLQDDILCRVNDNLLLNSNFKIWQRGTSFSNLSNTDINGGKYIADRWKYSSFGSQCDPNVYSIFKQVDDGMEVICTNPINVGNIIFGQPIEDYILKKN